MHCAGKLTKENNVAGSVFENYLNFFRKVKIKVLTVYIRKVCSFVTIAITSAEIAWVVVTLAVLVIC